MYNSRCIYILVYISLLMSLMLSGCARNTDVPQKLIGIWKTQAPKYADRFLAFDEYYLTLGLGAAGESSYIIKEIDERKQNSGTAYTFHYEDSEGEEWTLAFYYEPSDNGIIVLNNSNNVWKKVKPGE